MLPQRRSPRNPMMAGPFTGSHYLVQAMDRAAVVLRQFKPQPTLLADPHSEFRAEWQRDRLAAVDVDPVLRNHPPRESSTTLAMPWKTVVVPASRLRTLCESNDGTMAGHPAIWGMGPNRPAAKSNPLDVNERSTWRIRQSRCPGEGRFTDVVAGAYGERYAKYLYALDHRGLHIVREMTKCDASSRGIPLHSLLCEKAIVGGEIFFDAYDTGKVLINFGSARFPAESSEQAMRVAEFWLAIGYQTVVAMIPNREIGQGQYGFKDRYGENLQNMVFRTEEAQSRMLMCV
jgi:hypothetical protein